MTVLQDSARRAVVRISAGTDWYAAVRPNGRRAHGFDRTWRLSRLTWREYDVTYVVTFGDRFAIGLVTPASGGAPVKYYVNLQAPLRRRPWGFDTMDYELDVEVDPVSGRASWKDVARFRRLVRSGELTSSTARLVWREARRARVMTPSVVAQSGEFYRVVCAVPDLAHTLRVRRPPLAWRTS